MAIKSPSLRDKTGKSISVAVWHSPAVDRILPTTALKTLRASAEKMLWVAGIREYRLSIALLTGADMRRLNFSYLGHDYVTDVVTFDLSDKALDVGYWTPDVRFKMPENGRRESARRLTPHVSRPTVHGEICICPAEAKRNSKRYGEPFDQELRRYVAHGILHLLGWSDRTEKLRAVMRVKENELLEIVENDIGAKASRKR